MNLLLIFFVDYLFCFRPPSRLFFRLKTISDVSSIRNSDFYIVKLGFRGLLIIFLILLLNPDCGYSLEPPGRGGSNVYPQSMFRAIIRKISFFFSSENYCFYGREKSLNIAWACF